MVSKRKSENSKKSTEKNQRKIMTLALLIIGIIVATCIAVYNADTFYLSDKNNAIASIPDKLLSKSQNSILISTTNEKGEPIGNKDVIVSLEINNETFELFKGETDSDGICQPVIKIPDVNGTAKIIVKAGSETLTQNVTILDTLKIFLSTDKPIYQPSQTIHIRTLVYEGAIPKVSQKMVQIEIQTPNGDKIYRKNFKPNKFGICSLNYTLSDQLSLGNYKIKATVENKSIQKSVLVNKYVLPKFKIELEGIKKWYTVYEEISGAVNCKYFFGKKVEGSVTINARVYLGIWKTIAVKKGKLENGKFPFYLPKVNYAVGAPINNDNGYLELNITVVDESGHKEKESHLLTISKKPIMITLLNDNNIEGANSSYYILARYPDGLPVKNGETVFTIDNKDYKTKTDERGIASITFPYKNQKEIKVKITKNGLITTETFQIKASKGLKVISDKSHYEIGEIANCKVFYSGNSYTTIAYYEVVSNGFIVTTGHLELKKGLGNFNLPISLDMAPLSEIKVYKIEKNRNVILDTVVFGVSSSEMLDVKISSDKNLYKPNEDLNLQFLVKNSTSPLISALEVTIVDLSVFEISERMEGLEEIFNNLDDEFTTPQYQILNYIFSENASLLKTDTMEKVVEPEIGESRTILNVGEKNIVKAKEIENEWVSSFWTLLTLLGIIIYFAVFLFALKNKNEIGIAICIVLLIVIAGLSGLLINREKENETIEDAVPEIAPAGGEKAIDGVPREKSSFGTEEKKDTKKPTHVREYFPETWYWNPTLITDEKGTANINLLTPDSITTWGVKALASTIDAQFGVGTKNISVFQDFFVEPDIPISVIRNDRFPLKILVYNYVNETRNVSVEITNDSWFTCLSPLSQNVNVDANSVSSVEFTIIAKDVGENKIKVSAKNEDLEDIVIRIINVEPDGKKVEKLFNGELDNNQIAYATIKLNESRVLKSENAYVKLQGGMEAVTLDGAENYIHFVSGCGEQSMSTLSIDILAFDTVKNMKGTDEQLFKYENIVTQGIQHELTFLKDAKNGKGRGIVWFPGDKDVHPWLTSWGLITFQDAINSGFIIDEKIISDMQKWLISQQEKEGSFKFPEWGIYETNNPILKTKKVATTAYITRALLYSAYSQNSEAVKKAINYIEKNIKSQWKDSYTLALSLIALEDGDGDKNLRNEITTQLISLKKEDNDTVYWTTKQSMISSGRTEWFGNYNSHTIENTAYAIIALNKHGGQRDLVNKAVKYLLTHRKGLGGFFSTQDTVVAFQALSSVSEIKIKNLNVKVYVNNEKINETNFTKENKDLTYYIDLRPYLKNITKIKLESNGEGSVLYQIYYEEYIPWDIIGVEKQRDLELNVTYDATNISVYDTLTAHCQLKYFGGERIQMILIELKAPVGFSFSSDDFEYLLNIGTIDNYEIANREIMVYINDIKSNYSLDFNYQLVANKPIKGKVQGVKAWDMYNPDMKVETEPIEIESYENQK